MSGLTLPDSKDVPEEQCSICALVKFSDSILYQHRPSHHQTFHEKCGKCPPLASDHFCELCRHLHLKHILRCVRTGFKMKIGTLEELRSRSSCLLCSKINQLVQLETRNRAGNQKLSLRVETAFWVNEGFVRVTVGSYPHKNIPGLEFDITLADCCTYENTFGLEFDATLAGFRRLIPKETKTSEERINFRGIREWLKECKSHGMECQPITSKPLPTDFRVIDVQRNCVVRPPNSSCTYAALSYVWGDTKTGVAQNNTLKVLEEVGSLSSQKTPKTVSDAIEVCRELGQTYLWVDRLCIPQDDTDSPSIQEQLNAMGNIYAAAEFTIIDLDGTCADHGLPGVSQPRAFTQDRFTRLGVEFIQLLPHLRYFLKESTWASRGWTYQENLLSRRRLYFTKRAVFGVCSCKDRIEHWAEGEWGIDPNGDRDTSQRYNFPDALQDYSSRSLRSETDILRGFSGVLHAFHGDRHRCGIPFEEFDLNILWEADQKVGATTRESLSTEKFPSWSWIHVTGRCTLEPWSNNIIEVASFAFAAIGESNKGTLLPVQPRFERRRVLRQSEIDYDLDLAASVWRIGCVYGSQKCGPISETDGLTHRSFLEKNCTTRGELWKFLRSMGQNSRPRYLKEISEETVYTLQPYHLVVVTQTMNVKLMFFEGDESVHRRSVGLLVSVNQSLGKVTVYDPEFYSIFSLGKNYSCDIELLALSVKKLGRINVMLIKREGSLARRLGLGEVYLDRWEECHPEFKTVILE